MGKMNYVLEKGQTPRLEISWKGLNWKNVTIKLDGLEIGAIPGKKELEEGREFTLDKNTTLKVQLVKKFNTWELQVLVNGQPVPGSASDPGHRLSVAYGTVFLVAVVNIIIGIIAKLLKVDFLLDNGIGFYSVIFGMIMGIMGVLVWKKLSSVALGIAVALLIIDGIMGLIAGSFGGLVFRIFILIPMFGGFSAIKELKKRNKLEQAV